MIYKNGSGFTLGKRESSLVPRPRPAFSGKAGNEPGFEANENLAT